MWGRLPIAAAAAGIAIALLSPAQSQAPALDYEFFKSRVEPIFLKKREGHTRCYVCHAESNNAFRLEKMPAAADFWTEEQSRRNFDMAAALVTPGNPAKSRLLLHALAPEVGGSTFHSGGRQFASEDDPDWKVLAQWVSGKPAEKN